MSDSREYKGYNGTIVIDGATIQIERSGFVAKMGHAGAKEWCYPIFAVSAVSSNDPSMLTNGWITIQLGGDPAPSLGATSAPSHPNTVLFTKMQSETFKACLSHLEVLIQNNVSHGVESAQFLSAGTGGEVGVAVAETGQIQQGPTSASATSDIRGDIHAASKRMTSQFGGKREIKRLEGHLHGGEEVRILAKGRYENAYGIVALTTQRLMFLKEGLMGNTLEDFPLDKISSVQSKAGMLMGELKIYSSGNSSIIDQIPKQDQRMIAEALRQRIATSDAAPSTPNASHPVAPQIDVAEQLTKFAALRDQGVISEEEFAAQKSKLLGM